VLRAPGRILLVRRVNDPLGNLLARVPLPCDSNERAIQYIALEAVCMGEGFPDGRNDCFALAHQKVLRVLHVLGCTWVVRPDRAERRSDLFTLRLCRIRRVRGKDYKWLQAEQKKYQRSQEQRNVVHILISFSDFAVARTGA
jgi:hypothetical protein